MAQKRFQKNRRDPGRFIQVPNVVLDSPAYIGLSAYAVKLLWDVASQYKGDNNGKLLTGWKVMSEDRGWKSPITLDRAKKELLESGLLFETRKGARPNKSSWVAATWWHINWCPDMDIKEQEYPRGAYHQTPPIKNTPLSTVSVQAAAA